jgi:hypothetical protein
MRPKFPTWLPALLVFAGGVVAMKATHLGVFAEQSNARRDRGTVAAEPADGSTTSSTFDLARRSYQRGDCVRWDQSADARATRETKVVSCDEPHLIEITGRTTMPILKAYPTEAEWRGIIDNGECGKQVAAYLGGAIDPYGRFGVGVLQPTSEGWAVGDREIWCGVQIASFDRHSDTEAEPFTGKAQEQPQGFVYPVGTCLAASDATEGMGRVPCSEPHTYETVGDVDAGKAFSTPPGPDSAAWATKLTPACTTVARTVFGGPPPKGVEILVGAIDPASWRTGQRRAECHVARYDAARKLVILTAPLLPAR